MFLPYTCYSRYMYMYYSTTACRQLVVTASDMTRSVEHVDLDDEQLVSHVESLETKADTSGKPKAEPKPSKAPSTVPGPSKPAQKPVTLQPQPGGCLHTSVHTCVGTIKYFTLHIKIV